GAFRRVDLLFPGLVKDQMGAVDVPASAAGQSFGIRGNVTEEKNIREVRTVYRGCLWGYEPVTRCHTDSRGRMHCYTEMVRVMGSEPVEQEVERDEKRVRLSFRDGATDREVAHFQGVYELDARVIWERVVGTCRRY
ncbi:MAG: hypothetical protein HUU37_07490, partial [Bdellovibrionales bacterium]|nr:hypothetical protein [Bdellovibrionales bacterium]